MALASSEEPSERFLGIRTPYIQNCRYSYHLLIFFIRLGRSKEMRMKRKKNLFHRIERKKKAIEDL